MSSYVGQIWFLRDNTIFSNSYSKTHRQMGNIEFQWKCQKCQFPIGFIASDKLDWTIALLAELDHSNCYEKLFSTNLNHQYRSHKARLCC